MIDTVVLRHRIDMPPFKRLIELAFRKRRHSWDGSCWYRNPVRGGAYYPTLTWTQTPGGDWLSVQTSLPRWLYGRNTLWPSQIDIQRALEKLREFVEEAADVEFDTASALVGRVDYFADFRVGESNVGLYLDAIAKAVVPRFKRHTIESSVMFSSKSKVLATYDKEAEVHAHHSGGDAEIEATGMIRLESRNPTAGACNRLVEKYHLNSRTARSLLAGDVAFHEISEALAVLGLDKEIPGYDSRVDVLRDYYGDTALLRRLAGFLALFDRFGEGFWRHGCAGYSRSMYFEHLRLVKKAGAWLRSEMALPRLQLDESAFTLIANRSVA